MLNVSHRSVTDHHECQQNARTQQVLLINILKLRQQVVLIPKSEFLFYFGLILKLVIFRYKE